jgi:hypothetical protein
MSAIASPPRRCARSSRVFTTRQSPGEKSADAAQHDVLAPRQCLADGLVGLAAHQHGLADRERFEMPQIRGQVPRQPIAAADDIVFRDGNNQFQGGGPAAAFRFRWRLHRRNLYAQRRSQLRGRQQLILPARKRRQNALSSSVGERAVQRDRRQGDDHAARVRGAAGVSRPQNRSSLLLACNSKVYSAVEEVEHGSGIRERCRDSRL